MADVTYVKVPEYQPSQASITIGDPFYGASAKAEGITVRKTATTPSFPIMFVIVPAVIIVGWLALRHKFN